MIVPASPDSIRQAGDALRAGRLVAFPTETVYGLGADATSNSAVAAIFDAKRRPSFNPLIIHVTSIEAARELVAFDPLSDQLAARFWPGALTLVLPRRKDSPVSLLASAGLETIAIRVPAHETARAIIEAAGVPVAAPSANASGSVSPTRAEHVAQSLGDAVEIIVDAGPCPVGVESTVVSCKGATAIVLRPGGITVEELRTVAATVEVATGSTDAPASPGMLESHYAPAAALRLDAASMDAGEALLSFGDRSLPGGAEELNLSPRGDLREAAANLFAFLRELDSRHDRIAVVPIPPEGLGLAINDRLSRAAAPR
ncbi:MAG: L-threonylcarbamoyladenylate synthase [Alphaproteobacteria bacterium]